MDHLERTIDEHFDYIDELVHVQGYRELHVVLGVFVQDRAKFAATLFFAQFWVI
jgi:hypothetical protein